MFNVLLIILNIINLLESMPFRIGAMGTLCQNP